MSWAHLPQTRLYYEASGAGHPVVFIHGGCLDCRTWDRQAGAVTRSYTMFRYDLRGHGRSEAPPRGYSVRCLAGELRELVRHWGLTRPTLVGHSLGGCVAIEYALANPAALATLVLVGTGIEGFPYAKPLAAQMERRRSLLAREGVSERLLRAMLRSPIFDGVRRRPIEKALVLRMMAAWSGANWLDAEATAMPPEPQAQLLRRIGVPTLVVVGERDTERAQQIAQRIVTQVRVVRKEVVPEAGHLAPLEAASVFNDILIDFLGGAVGKALA